MRFRRHFSFCVKETTFSRDGNEVGKNCLARNCSEDILYPAFGHCGAGSQGLAEDTLEWAAL
jgi:hypothetical protein